MDISTNYLGKHFENPFILASAPPTANAEMIKRAFEAGWAGAVIKTLIQEPVKNLQNRFATYKMGKKIIGFENIELLSELTPEEWYKDIQKLKKDFPHKIVVGSIMGDAKNKNQWVEMALGCQDAGVDFLELNFSCPHGYPAKGKGAAIGQDPEYSAMITLWLKEDSRIKVPIIPKMTPAITNISSIGEAVANAGADGICAVNTFPVIMGFNLRTLKPKPDVGGYTTAGGMSGASLKPVALRCVNDLVENPGLPVMACGGISSGFDAVEFMLLGAPVVQVCTEVMLKGYSIISKMKKEVSRFMEWHGYSSIKEFIGLGTGLTTQYSELDQDFKVTPSVDPVKCNGCQVCFVSCRDGGYQAIKMKEHLAVIIEDRCSGCSLCFQVCPQDAIQMVEN